MLTIAPKSDKIIITVPFNLINCWILNYTIGLTIAGIITHTIAQPSPVKHARRTSAVALLISSILEIINAVKNNTAGYNCGVTIYGWCRRSSPRWTRVTAIIRDITVFLFCRESPAIWPKLVELLHYRTFPQVPYLKTLPCFNVW